MAKTFMLLGVIFVLLLVAVFVYTMPAPSAVVSKHSGGSIAVAANNGVATTALVQNNAVEVTAEVL